MQRKGAIVAGQSNDTVPGDPTIVTITPGIGQLSIAFTAGSDGGRPITSYDISTDNGVSWTNTAQTDSPFLVTGLQSGVEYSIKIRAYNMEGYGAWSTMVAATPYGVPDAPTINTVSPGVQSLYVSFSAPSFNGGKPITNYEYSIDSGSWTAFSPASTSSPLQIPGLSDGVTYSARIRAVNIAGGGAASNNVSGQTANVPSKPSAPSIISVGNQSVSISWTPPSANYSTITGYKVQLSSDNGSTWSPALSTSGTSATITSLTNGTSYVFRINASNGVGISEWSDKSSSAIPFTTPSAPQSVSATKGDTQATVSWSAPSSNGGYSIYDYHLDYKLGSGSWTGAGTTTGTSKTITGLTNGSTYTFRVHASNAGNTSVYGTLAESNSVVPSGVPLTPATPSLTAGDKSVTVTFTAPGSNGSDVTGFKFRYSSNSGSSWTDGGTAGATDTTKTISSLSNGSSYIVQVLATNANGDGAWSASSGSATPYFGQPSVTPSSVEAGVLQPGVRTATITFDPPDAVNYDRTEVYVAFSGQEQYLGTADTLKATKYSSDGTGSMSISFTAVALYIDGYGWFDYSLSPSQELFYRVVTYNSDGYSNQKQDSFTVKALVPSTRYDWVYTTGVDVYTTGTWTLSSNSYSSTGSGHTSGQSIGGVGLDNVAVGDTQYTLTSLVITANSGASASASSSTRYFVVDFSGTNTTLAESTTNMTNVTETSTQSNTWSGFGNTGSQSYTWNITNVAYGNPGAGRVRVRKGGTSTSPSIAVTIVARGNKRVWTAFDNSY